MSHLEYVPGRIGYVWSRGLEYRLVKRTSGDTRVWHPFDLIDGAAEDAPGRPKGHSAHCVLQTISEIHPASHSDLLY